MAKARRRAGTPKPGHRYWRLYITAANGDEYLNILAIEFKNNSSTVSPTNMTADNAPIPYDVSESSAFSSSFEGWKAFDGNASTDWGTADTTMPQWILLDMGQNVEADEISIHNKDHGGGRGPQDFKVQYSDDGANFTDAHSVTGETSWSGDETRSYTW